MLPPLTRAVFRYGRMDVEWNDYFALNSEIIGELRTRAYERQWKMCFERRWYHIRLEDHSLLAFNYDALRPSYQFLDCPLSIPTLREYLDSQKLSMRDRHSPDVQDEYRQVIETAAPKTAVTPIRYDFDAGSYRCGVHPAGHIHIGLENEIRFGVRREMSPLGFVMMVVRQRYPENWELILESTLREGIPSHVRDALRRVTNQYFDNHDYCEMYLE